MPRITLKLSKSTGLGTLEFNGTTYKCGGNVDFNYPSDTTIDGYKEDCHHSKEYDVDMNWSVLWIGQKGIYFHEWTQLEGSAGCIHLLKGDAKKFYDSIKKEKTRIVFSWTK